MRPAEHFTLSASQTGTSCDVPGFVQWGVIFREVDLEDKSGDCVHFFVVIRDQGNARLNEAAALSRAMDLMLSVQDDKPVHADG